MMSSKKRALEMLRSGVPWEEISSHFGKSTLYSALSEYFPWAEAHTTKLRGEIRRLGASVDDCRQDEADMSARVNVLKHQLEELESRQSRCVVEVEALSVDVESKRKQLSSLEEKSIEFRDRGVTEDTVLRISQIEFGDGEELLARIETFEAHGELEEDVKSRRGELDAVNSDVEAGKKVLEEISSEVDSCRNRLDEWQRKAWMWKDAQNVMLSFFRDGYDTATLISLKKAVNVLAVKGEPKVTVKRFLDAFGDIQGLSEIESTLREKKMELTRTRGELDRATGSLKAVKVNVLDEISSTVDVASIQLKAVNAIAVSTLQDQSTRIEESFMTLSKEIGSELNNIRKESEAAIRATGDTGMRNLQGLNSTILKNFDELQEEVRKWGEIKAEMGAYSDMILYGTTLLGVLKDSEALMMLPVELVAQLFERLLQYVECLYPGMNTSPPESVAKKEMGFSQYRTYKLSSLIEWLRYELENKLRTGRIRR